MLRAADWLPNNEKPSLSPKKQTPQVTDIEELVRYIENEQIDITSTYDDWLKIGFALANEYGEAGREYFHRISRFHPEYSKTKTDIQFDACLKADAKNWGSKVTIKTLFAIAKDSGVQISHFPTQSKREKGNNGKLGTMGNVGSCFVVKKTNDVMRDAANQAPRKCFFYGLITEGENTILVGDNGIGKTVFAVQIGESLAKLGLTALYLDLELSDKQFEERFSETTVEEIGSGENLQRIVHCSNPYIFPDTFYRATFSDESIPSGMTYEEFFLESLENCIKEVNPQVIIVDNMSKLCSGDTDQAKTAKPMMDNLCRLKSRYGVTTILLEHTRKTDARTPLDKNQMQGSKMKSNLIDNVIGIAASANDIGIRYVKELKVRSRRWEYNDDNVLVLELVKDANKLRFEIKGTSPESDHLKQVDATDTDYIKNEAIKLYQTGSTIVEIGLMLHKSKSAIGRIIKTFKDSQFSQNSHSAQVLQVGNGK